MRYQIGVGSFAGVALLLAVLCTAACGGARVIGVVLAGDGPDDPVVASCRSGMEVAAADVQAVTEGHRVEIVWRETSGSPEQAAIAATDLIRDHGARILIAAGGPAQVDAVAAVAEELGAVVVVPASRNPSPTLTAGVVLSLAPPADCEAERAARFLARDRHCQRVAVVSDGSSINDRLVRAFTSAFTTAAPDGKVVAAADPTATDGVFVAGDPDGVMATVAAWRGRGFHGPICTTSAINVGSVISDRGELLDEVVWAQPSFNPAANRTPAGVFAEGFRRRYGREPDLRAALGHDALAVAVDFARRTGDWNDHDLGRTMRYQVLEYPGATGAIRFTDHGGVMRQPVMYIASGGRAIRWETYVEEKKKEIGEAYGLLLEDGDGDGNRGAEDGSILVQSIS